MKRTCVLATIAALPLLLFLGLKSPAFDTYLAGKIPVWAEQHSLSVSLETLDFDPWGPRLVVEGLILRAAAQEFEIAAASLDVRFHFLRSLLGTPHLSLRTEALRVVGEFGGAATGDSGPSALPNVVLETAQVRGASVSVRLPDLALAVDLPSIEVDWVGGRGTAQVDGGRVLWHDAGEEIRRVHLEGKRRFGVLQVDDLSVETERATLAVRGRVGLLGLCDLDTRLGLDLTSLPPAWVGTLGLGEAPRLGGRVKIAGEVKGALPLPAFQGTLELTEGIVGPIQVGDVTARVALRDRQLGFEDLEARSSVGTAHGVRGRLLFGDALRLEAEGEAEDYDLRGFMAIFVEDYFPVGVQASGRFSAEGPLWPELALECRVNARGRDLDVTVPGADGRETYFRLPAAAVRSRCTVGAEEIRFGETRIESDSVSVEIPTGRILYTEGLWFDTVVSIRDLRLIQMYLPDGFDAAGKASGRFGGPYHSLEFQYDLDLDRTRVLGVEVGSVRGRAEYDLEAVRSGGLVVEGPLGTLRVDGSCAAVPGGTYDLALEWSGVDLERLVVGLGEALGTEVPRLAGIGTARGRLGGTLDEPVFAGLLGGRKIEFRGHTIDELEAEGVVSARGEWTLEKGRAVAYEATVRGRGRGDTSVLAVDGEVEVSEIGTLVRLLGGGAEVAGRFGARFALRGSYTEPRLDLEGDLRDARVTGTQVGDVWLAGHWAGEQVRIEAKSRRGAARATLSTELRAPFPFALDLEAKDLRWEEVPLPGVPAGLVADSLSGNGTIEGAFQAEIPTWKARWEGAVEGFRWEEIAVGRVGVTADYAKGGTAISLFAWEGSFALEALLAFEPGTPIALELALEKFELSRLGPLSPVPSGHAWARAQALLSLEEWNARGGMSRLLALADFETSGRIAGVVLEDDVEIPPLEFRGRSPRGLPELTLVSQGLEAIGRIETLEPLAWTVEARLQEYAPQQFLARFPTLSDLGGRLSAELTVSGRERQVVEGFGQGRWSGLTWGPLTPSDWAWTARWAGARLEAEAVEGRGVTVGVVRSPDGDMEVHAELRDAPLEGWVETGVAWQDLSGVASGRVDLSVPSGGEPQGRLELTRVVLSLPPYLMLQNRTTIVANYREGRLDIAALELMGQGVDLTLSGGFRPGEDWDLDAAGAFDLTLLGLWVPQIERASGQGKAALEVRGPWAAPTLEGPFEIYAGASVGIEGLDRPLTDLDARFYFQNAQGVRVDWLDAAFGDGRVHLEGTLGLDQFAPRDLRMVAELRDIQYQYPSRVEYTFDSDLLFTGMATSPEVRGEVRLGEFLFAQRTSLQGLLLEAMRRRPREVRGVSDRSLGVYVDVSVRGSENLRVQNNLSDLALDADLRVRGYLPDVALWGRVAITEGTLEVRGQEYDMLQSSIEFLGETQPAPLLDLRARTVIANYSINVDVSGPLDDFEVAMSSSPPLPHDELVSLLTLGKRPGEVDGGQSLTAVEAGSFLTGGIQEEVQGATGLDEFSIDAAESVSGQSTVPRVTVGKVVTKQVRARYSAALGTETEQNAELQYILNPRVSLLGTWNDKGEEHKGSVGGEVRFRFTFR